MVQIDIMYPKSLCVLALLLVTLVGVSSSVEYQGYTEYDGRDATLVLTFNGPAVTGRLSIQPVCESQEHLTGVNVNLIGTATGTVGECGLVEILIPATER